jgi:hypothetical protein
MVQVLLPRQRPCWLIRRVPRPSACLCCLQVNGIIKRQKQEMEELLQKGQLPLLTSTATTTVAVATGKGSRAAAQPQLPVVAAAADGADDGTCPICMDEMLSFSLTRCGHKFCPEVGAQGGALVLAVPWLPGGCTCRCWLGGCCVFSWRTRAVAMPATDRRALPVLCLRSASARPSTPWASAPCAAWSWTGAAPGLPRRQLS